MIFSIQIKWFFFQPSFTVLYTLSIINNSLVLEAENSLIQPYNTTYLKNTPPKCVRKQNTRL